ncbi:MAG: protein-methionine-sulfoxide reductase catalytic subunit MsrP [Candidatus Nitrohelix vancouverensis]|uniref:Protein-methionine-sulfoxide reductase catalytic subunit MsrP n=1 Tax=Candidatus Nitrohelix vancouverensis TaxID=2705534 RepID=A0A7T0C077_9BACT|nr:MAG: protein-methionine-sulfoxide reductase catalytic subunit MsrP [Candidatus Nitrohelix vancouverensis]
MKLRRANRDWELRSSRITPESVFMNRRAFMQGSLWAAGAALGTLSGCSSDSPMMQAPEPSMTALEQRLYPATRNSGYALDRPITEPKIAGSYNNFFEFGEDKGEIQFNAAKLETRPWTLEISGLVNKPQIYDLDDLLKQFPLEERLYRLRCVEAWAMAVPWTGFPLNELLRRAEPKSSATHVRFLSFYNPVVASGQRMFWRPWPYAEGLTLPEAMNELSFLATGVYGKPLPKQHGAPLRLLAPWKYGYKSAKSIVRIEVIDFRPPTFWSTLQGLEYNFSANVDPDVPHPRWSQASEKMIGTGEIFPTQLYNGYQKYVAGLYT